METVSITKRIIIYILSGLLYSLIGYGSALPFLLLLKINIWIYIAIGLAFSVATSILLIFFLLWLAKGYTIVSFFFGVKVVGVEEKNITPSQALIRAFNESVVIFAILDLFYLISHRTERGVIDRLSDTFMIDIRR